LASAFFSIPARFKELRRIRNALLEAHAAKAQGGNGSARSA
jgi:hypothetical protein